MWMTSFTQQLTSWCSQKPAFKKDPCCTIDGAAGGWGGAALHPPTLPLPPPPLHQSKCWHPNTAFSRPHPLHHSTISKSAVLLPPTALPEISGWNMCELCCQPPHPQPPPPTPHCLETASLQSALKPPLLLREATRSPCLCWSIYLNAYQWDEVCLGMPEGLFWWCQMSNIWLLIELYVCAR